MVFFGFLFEAMAARGDAGRICEGLRRFFRVRGVREGLALGPFLQNMDVAVQARASDGTFEPQV